VAQQADDSMPSTSAAASADEQPVQHVSKKAKLFDFMSPSTATRPVTNQLAMTDLSRQFDLFKSDGDLQSSGLEVFNEKRFSGLMNKFIHHEGRLNNNMQKWRKEKEKENNNR